MKNNKSIDGLSTRRSKTAASSTHPKSTKAKSAQPKSVKSKATPAKTTKTNVTKAKAPKPKTTPSRKTTKTQAVASPQRTRKPITKSLKSPKSLEPVQPIKQDSSSDTPAPISEAQFSSIATATDFLQPTQVFNFDEETGRLEATDTTPTHTAEDNPKPKKVKNPVSKKHKIITSIILIVILLLIGAVTWLVLWGNDIIAKITGGQGNIFDFITFTEPTYEPLKTDANGRTNILAIGTSGYNMEGDEGEGTHDGAQLTDSIMIISLNQNTGDVAMLSLPRDLKASPTCTATGKINEVYWCNNMDGDNEQAGAEALMAEVGDILNIDFQYYAHLNWGSLIQIVDLLGGINVTLDENIEDYYYTGAVFEAGQEYTLNGEQALGLARARHGTAGGDFSRGASQQKILIGIKDKIFEKGLSLTDIIGLASTLGDNLRTNFNVEELKSLAHLASEFDFNAIRQVSLVEPEMLMTTGTINGISYVLPAGGVGYYARIQDYVAKMFSNNPSIYEDATILVLNSTDTPYLATNEQTALQEEGYQNIAADNAPEGTYEGEYTLYSLTDTKPGTKALLESKYQITARPAEELPESISHDYDFIIIIGDPSEEQ